MSNKGNDHVGEEVTCLIIPWYIEECERRGLMQEQLLARVDYPIEHLYDKSRRIDWAAMRTICTNMGKYFSDEDLADIGTTAMDAPSFRYLIALVRLLYSTREFYRWSLLDQYPLFVRALTVRILEPHRSRMIFEYRMKNGHSNCREFASVVRGQLIVFPVVLGFPPAQVEMELLEDGASYDIRFKEGGGLLSWARKIVQRPFVIRTTAQELRDAHNLLQRRYDALESESQARAKAEEAGARIREDEQTRIQLYLSGTLSGKMEEMKTAIKRLQNALETEYLVEHEMAQAMRHACEDTRREIKDVVRALSPSNTGAGLLESLRSMCDEMCTQSSVDVRFTSVEAESYSDVATGYHLFRIAQEAVTNALRHGSPSRIEVNLGRDNDHFTLSIVDDGTGFSPSERRYNRMGIEIMRRRAELIGGSLQIDSVVGAGTKILCTVKAATDGSSRLQDATV